jgi:hypothetical protein
MKKKFGILFGPKGKRKQRMEFDKEYERTMYGAGYAGMGLRVRHYTRKVAAEKKGWK